jgi:hypothetical protein
MASLTAQRDAIASASDHEMIRARWLVQFVFGNFGRVVRSQPGGQEVDNLCGPPLLVPISRPAIPILVMVLRHNTLQQNTMSMLFDLAKVVDLIDRGCVPFTKNTGVHLRPVACPEYRYCGRRGDELSGRKGHRSGAVTPKRPGASQTYEHKVRHIILENHGAVGQPGRGRGEDVQALAPTVQALRMQRGVDVVGLG